MQMNNNLQPLPQTRKEKIELLNNLQSGKVKLEQLSFRTGYVLWHRTDDIFYNHTTKKKASLEEFMEAKRKAEDKDIMVMVHTDGQHGFDEEHSSPEVIEIEKKIESEI